MWGPRFGISRPTRNTKRTRQTTGKTAASVGACIPQALPGIVATTSTAGLPNRVLPPSPGAPPSSGTGLPPLSGPLVRPQRKTAAGGFGNMGHQGEPTLCMGQNPARLKCVQDWCRLGLAWVSRHRSQVSSGYIFRIRSDLIVCLSHLSAEYRGDCDNRDQIMVAFSEETTTGCGSVHVAFF